MSDLGDMMGELQQEIPGLVFKGEQKTVKVSVPSTPPPEEEPTPKEPETPNSWEELKTLKRQEIVSLAAKTFPDVPGNLWIMEGVTTDVLRVAISSGVLPHQLAEMLGGNGSGKEKKEEGEGSPPPPSSLDEERVRELAREEDEKLIQGLDEPVTKRVKIWIEEGALEVYNREEAKKEPPQPEILVVSEHKETKISGKGKHKVFPMLVKLLAARTNVFLVGPPGTGKTTLAVQAAEALELPFGSCSLSPDMDSSELLGFLNAAGTYVNTVFHERYTKGGVFLADEIDNGDPNITAKLNQAIENGVCPFPYGMATKHENFRLIVAGNTWGTGPTSQFLGRNALDPATNDRFVHLFVPIDEGLEMAIAKAQNPDKEQVKAWVALVRKWRAAANKQHIRLVVSPRASIVGSRLLAAGVPQEEVAEMLVWRGVDKETRKKVEVD